LQGAGRDALAALPGADLYVSLNAHQGRPEVLTSWLDASVVDEWDPVPTDAELDPFSAANGPPYAPEFIARYRAAQQARNQRITDWAKTELVRLNAAGIPDRLFPLYRVWGDLRFMDGAIDPSDRPTPQCYRGDPAAANRGPGVGRANTLKTWLSMWSLETSRCRGGEQLAKIDAPALVVLGTSDTGVFPSDARSIFASLASTDKTLQFVPGSHYFEDSVKCRHDVTDLMCEWISARI
jgi:pimeloyl-ACP methyl ester carboxylesterase